MNRVILAGTSSGVGKTTVSIGIMAALKRRGVKLAPFKVGPDYIDPGFHKFVTGTPSCNLDSWMLTEGTMKYLFKRNMEDKEIGIVEGVMGLYDGFGTAKDQGSTAHVAKLLSAPTILIIDGKAMSSSAAATVLGYKLYDQEINIKGVIVNKVSGKTHYELIKKVIEQDVKIPCLGYLPSNLNVSLKSRHLGLIPVEEISTMGEKIAELADIVEECIDLDLLIEISKTGGALEEVKNPFESLGNIAKGLTIGVAKDKAFSFYYEDNLKVLEELGVKKVYFSPLEDVEVPNDLDGIYLGGGFPEVFADELQRNMSFKKSLKLALQKGVPTYAECGGLMYLTEGIKDLEENFYDMVGFFPVKAEMTNSLQRFGYVEVTTKTNISIKAHEFHRSKVEAVSGIEYNYHVEKRRDGEVINSWNCGLMSKNVLAGYPHIHFYSNPDFLIQLIERCKEYKNEK